MIWIRRWVEMLLTITFVAPLFAQDQDLVDLYRQQGISAVEEALQQELKNPAYWDHWLENRDTRFGLIETYRWLLLSNKAIPNLQLFSVSSDSIQLVSEESAYIGEGEGDKEREGDLKTPVGVYDLSDKLTQLDDYYGPLAFSTNYPNLLDRLQGKNGYGIWIHGVPSQGERPANTRGCIAVTNPYILQLDSQISHAESVLLISESELPEVSKSDLSAILGAVYSWREAWKNSDVERYLGFYGQDFRRFDGKDIAAFSQMKRRIFRRKEDKTIIFKNFNILPYPNNQGEKLFRVDFHETYHTDSYRFEGRKELYVRLDQNRMTIIAEK